MNTDFKFSELSPQENNVENIRRLLKNEISRLDPDSAADSSAITRLIFHSLKGWNATEIFAHSPDPLSPFILSRIDGILTRLALHEPIQYILGEGRFYGMDIEVNPSTLIPRHETEELVELIVKNEEGKKDLEVLDIGTGSGAIAIALARNLIFPKITAIDISAHALETARSNAIRLNADITFLLEDIFSYSPQPDSFDIIVSNPPYISESEKSGIEKKILDYEPASALFVNDEDPLVFYRRIADIGLSALTDGGRIYFEINPLFSERLVRMMEKSGYSGILLYQDISRRERFLSAIIRK